MKLYYAQGACSMASHIVMHELGLKFDAVPVNMKTKEAKGENYLQINPKGYVPALKLDSGEVLTEGAVIMQYLADQKPTSGLAPAAGTMARYRCQEWLNFIATEVHKNFSVFFGPPMSYDAKEKQLHKIMKRLEHVSKHLETHDYLMGYQFTIADAYLFTILNWKNFLSIDLSRFPTLLGYMARIQNRPSTLSAMKAEGMLG